jgi:hypothetical protein
MELQMPKPKWYSPQLSRELVSRLYHRAKAERIPMTKLANKIIEQALDNKKQINTQRVVENRNITQSK